MTVSQAIIRRTSGGKVFIETPEGLYPLSQEHLRNILFYGHRVPVIRDSGDTDSKAVIFGKRPGFNGARRIFFVTAGRSFSIADISFISVVKGKWAAASMVPDPSQVAGNA
ncbi:MAG: hypothetical protein ABFC71_02990 [Methanoregula sp.]